MDIGSNFLIEHLNEKIANNLDKYLLFFGEYKYFFDSGRSALKYIAKSVKKKSILLPDYLCESMIKPFVDEGFEIYTYKINEDLSINISSIDLNINPGIFMFLEYFGFNKNYLLRETLERFKIIGTIIIQDITHSIFSMHKNDINVDYYVCSLRKWFGIPDGAVLVGKNKIRIGNLLEINNKYVSFQLYADYLKTNKYILGIENRSFLTIYDLAEEELNQKDFNEIHRISDISMKIIKQYDFDSMIKKRIENFKYLYDNLLEMEFITLPFIYKESDVPLFLPILVHANIRNKLKSFLVSNNIFTPIHWNKPIITPLTFSNNLYERELSIPCDQRYDIADMDRIIRNIKKFKEEYL